MAVDTVSKDVSAMIESARDGRNLMGGTKAMRAAGERYLPKFPKENEQGYKARLTSTFLFNGYRKTVRDITGRIFAKPVETDALDADFANWLSNVDMLGNDLSVFSRQVFEDAIGGCGVAYILVDAPQKPGQMTRGEAMVQGYRPYMRHLRVEDVVGWRAETINNALTLTQFRFHEVVFEPDPEDRFNDIEAQQIRVLELIEGRVWFELWRKNDKGKYAIYQEATPTDLTAIPVVPFYVNRTGFMTGEPLLGDLADVNIAHWQTQSDQRTALHYYRVPMLVLKGVERPEGGIVISAGVAHEINNPDGDVYWASSKDAQASMAEGWKDIEKLEFQMEAFGLQLTVSRAGAQSATGEALDAAKETSQLAMIADGLQDALEMALIIMADIGGLSEAPNAIVNKEFGVNMLSAQEVTVLLSAVNTGNMSRELFLDEMRRRGMIAGDIDLEAEMARIDEAGLTGVE